MNTSVLNPAATSPTAVLAVDVGFSMDALHIRLSDGREVSVPLEWFPRLRDATPKQRADWRLIARGIGIHWEDVDEDIAVTTLLRAGWSNVERASAPRKKTRRQQKAGPILAKKLPAKRAPATTSTRRQARALAGSQRSGRKRNG
ncbi:MAG: DUF2442 domain-containing protein [Chloroflexi bacterium]|nr:DUF2442 domain-containing protein [Chloroflexota bacterium]